MVCFKYYRSLFTVIMCVAVGLCMNCESLLTANDMLGSVRKRYCSPPMTNLNSMLSTKEVPSINMRVVVVKNKVDTSLAPNMFVFLENILYIFMTRQEKASCGGNDIHAKEKMKGPHVF